MVKVFFSYSHVDEALRNELEKHLSMLKNQGLIETWHDRRITAGEKLNSTISKNLEEADIILLLVSSDFLASYYCYEIEMKRAMERHGLGEARVVPIILRSCDWHSASFGSLLALPPDGKPITKYADRDDAFLDVVKGLKKVINDLRTSSPPTVATIQPGGASKPVRAMSLEVPRSSNLAIKKSFNDQQKHEFLEKSFEYISNFFENSLTELESRNSEISFNFKRIDANHFSAIIYLRGKTASQCRIWSGRNSRFGADLSYSSNASGNDNGFNEAMYISDNGYELLLKPMGMQTMGRQSKDSLLSMQGAAEYFWEILIRPLQS